MIDILLIVLMVTGGATAGAVAAKQELGIAGVLLYWSLFSMLFISAATSIKVLEVLKSTEVDCAVSAEAIGGEAPWNMGILAQYEVLD